jgi:hypothetical protein
MLMETAKNGDVKTANKKLSPLARGTSNEVAEGD